MGLDAGQPRRRLARRVAAAGGRRTFCGADRARHRLAHRPLLHLVPHPAAAGADRSEAEGLAAPIVLAQRTPTFCSGCPHNTSTHVPEGSRAVAGIGCHYMVTWMDRGRPPSRTWAAKACRGSAGALHRGKHIFANLGDGTYFHSGLLAIRRASPPATRSPTRSSTTMPWR